MPTHGSRELDEDAEKLIALGADPGPAFLTLDDLCSPYYRRILSIMSEKHSWAGGGAAYVDEVARLCRKCEATSLLDYGCGTVDMGMELVKAHQAGRLPRSQMDRPLIVQSYDPGVRDRKQLPNPADVVMCVDVLEHVEPDKVQAVLRHIYSLTIKCALLVIATRPADKRLPDGRNAHLTIDNSSWWQHQLRDLGGWKGKVIESNDDVLHMWWRKLDTTNIKTLE
jgi:hypothetical protein